MAFCKIDHSYPLYYSTHHTYLPGSLLLCVAAVYFPSRHRYCYLLSTQHLPFETLYLTITRTILQCQIFVLARWETEIGHQRNHNGLEEARRCDCLIVFGLVRTTISQPASREASREASSKQASRPQLALSLCRFLRFGSASTSRLPTFSLPHLSQNPLLPLLSPPLHPPLLQSTHSTATICFLHSLALTVGSLISIQSSRYTHSCHFTPSPLPSPSIPASLPSTLQTSQRQPHPSAFVQVSL